MSTIEEDAAKRRDNKRKPQNQTDESTADDQENQGDSNNGTTEADDNVVGLINEGVSGVSKKNFVMSVDNDP